MNESTEKPRQPDPGKHPWSEESGFRVIFDVLLAVALILAGIGYIQQSPKARTTKEVNQNGGSKKNG